jgi:hypothetical protein
MKKFQSLKIMCRCGHPAMSHIAGGCARNLESGEQCRCSRDAFAVIDAHLTKHAPDLGYGSAKKASTAKSPKRVTQAVSWLFA